MHRESEKQIPHPAKTAGIRDDTRRGAVVDRMVDAGLTGSVRRARKLHGRTEEQPSTAAAKPGGIKPGVTHTLKTAGGTNTQVRFSFSCR